MKKLKTMAATLAATFALGVGSLAAPAMAQEAEPIAPGNINPDSAVSLTIHKYADAEVDDPAADGTELANPGFEQPLEGVVFEVIPVQKDGANVDLTDPTEWDAIADLTAGDLPNGTYTLGAPQEVTTGADGSATTSDLKQTLYLVREVNTGENTVARMAAPFLVTLPFPHTTGWLYDVHVYPKNELSSDPTTDKTADTPSSVMQEGSIVPFTIASTIPAAQQYNLVKVTDTPDSKLAVDTDSITVTLNDTELALDTDYELTTDPMFTVEFTASGLEKLNVGEENTLMIAYDATVNGTGVIANTTSTYVNNPDTTTATDTESTNWGDFTLTKTDSANSALLAGAEFQLFEVANGQPTGDPIASYTTDENGEIADTLFIGNGDVKTKDYILVETKAPAGYQLPTGADAQHRMTLTPNTDGSFTQVTVDVENTKQEGFELPLTGAAGQVILGLLGTALAAITVGVAIVTVRRRHN